MKLDALIGRLFLRNVVPLPFKKDNLRTIDLKNNNA
jgi:hypothetical protein